VREAVQQPAARLAVRLREASCKQAHKYIVRDGAASVHGRMCAATCMWSLGFCQCVATSVPPCEADQQPAELAPCKQSFSNTPSRVVMRLACLPKRHRVPLHKSGQCGCALCKACVCATSNRLRSARQGKDRPTHGAACRSSLKASILSVSEIPLRGARDALACTRHTSYSELAGYIMLRSPARVEQVCSTEASSASRDTSDRLNCAASRMHSVDLSAAMGPSTTTLPHGAAVT